MLILFCIFAPALGTAAATADILVACPPNLRWRDGEIGMLDKMAAVKKQMKRKESPLFETNKKVI